MDGVGGCGLGADGLADRRLARLVLAPPSACAAFAARGLRWRRPRCRQRRERPAPSRRRAKRRLRSPLRRSQAARSPCRLLVSRKLSPPALRQLGWQRQWRRPSPRPFHPALSRSDRLPGKRRRKMPASSRRTSRHRTSARRPSIWRGGSSRPWRRPCRPWRRPCVVAALSLRALAAALRSFESLRAALSLRCGSVVARAVVGRGLRIVGAARGGRVVLGAIVVVAGGRIAVDQRREAVVSGDGSESGRADLRRASGKMRLPILLT